MTETSSRAAEPERTVRLGMRGTLVALVAFLLGAVGLVLGALPVQGADGAAGGGSDGAAHGGHDHAGAVGGGVVAGSIRVFGAYIREPASPDVAAAYLSIENDGDQPDTLLSVTSGGSRTVTLHDVPGGTPGGTASGAPGDGTGGDAGHPDTGGMTPSGPLTISGGTTVTLAPSRGHLMLDGLTGPLRPGDRVSLLLTFQRAGQVLVDAPVIAIADPAPTQGGTR